jgi:6-phosphogluconolactonase (cycloisomerase 2 family)
MRVWEWGGFTRRQGTRPFGVGLAALVFALSAGVAHAVFGSLTFVDLDRDGVAGVNGLDGAAGVAASPDGAHVYATGAADSAVATFSRDPATGALSFVEQDQDGMGPVNGIANALDVAVSPNGAHAYVVGPADNAVATFSRNGATGGLTWVELDQDGVLGVNGLASAARVAVSPNGAHVYVTGQSDDAVVTFSRNTVTGRLSFVEFDTDGGGVDGLNAALEVAVSPDGANVYVTGLDDDGIATFSRNTANGMLSFVEVDKDGIAGVDGLNAPGGIAVSPDGGHVYVTGAADHAVVTFSRNPSSGALSFVELDRDGVDGVDGLMGARNVAVAPDGAHVYVTGSFGSFGGAVATFSRDPTTGALSFQEADKEGVDGVDGLAGAGFVAPSPDGTHVYATGFQDDAVVTFAREGPPAVGGPASRAVSFDASKAKKGKEAGKRPLLAVKKGKKARFAGDVSAPEDVTGCESNQTVDLQRKKPKQATFTTFEQLQTDGVGSFSTKKKIKKTFEYRAVLGSTGACTDATSGTEKVKAKRNKKK